MTVSYKGKTIRFKLHIHLRSGKTTSLPVCDEYSIDFDHAANQISKIQVDGMDVGGVGQKHVLIKAMRLSDIEFIEVEYVQ